MHAEGERRWQATNEVVWFEDDTQYLLYMEIFGLTTFLLSVTKEKRNGKKNFFFFSNDSSSSSPSSVCGALAHTNDYSKRVEKLLTEEKRENEKNTTEKFPSAVVDVDETKMKWQKLSMCWWERKVLIIYGLNQSQWILIKDDKTISSDFPISLILAHARRRVGFPFELGCWCWWKYLYSSWA